MTVSDADPSFALLPEVETRALLAGSKLRFVLLRPDYAAIGLGTLRTLRVRERNGSIEIVAGYDGYERVPIAEQPVVVH